MPSYIATLFPQLGKVPSSLANPELVLARGPTDSNMESGVFVFTLLCAPHLQKPNMSRVRVKAMLSSLEMGPSSS